MARRPALSRGAPPTQVTARCLCGAMATVRSEAGRWFCAEHVPRPEAKPPPRLPASPPDTPRPAPRQGSLDL